MTRSQARVFGVSAESRIHEESDVIGDEPLSTWEGIAR